MTGMELLNKMELVDHGGTITVTISYDEQEAFIFLPYIPLLD